MRLYVGRCVEIVDKYGINREYNHRIGYIQKKNKIIAGEETYSIMFYHILVNNGQKCRKNVYAQIPEKNIKPFYLTSGPDFNELELAIYEGLLIHIRKKLKKIPECKRLTFGPGIQVYIDRHKRGFYKTKNVELVCDFKMKFDEYKIEVI